MHKSHDHPPRSIHKFGLRIQVAGLPESATFNDSNTYSDPESATGEGGRWLRSPFCTPPPPHQGILIFCLILLSYMSPGLFFGCKLSLLKQHIFLIITQPTWDGYLLLNNTKSSIRSLAMKLSNYFWRNDFLREEQQS